jgi:hypothetical protein
MRSMPWPGAIVVALGLVMPALAACAPRGVAAPGSGGGAGVAPNAGDSAADATSNAGRPADVAAPGPGGRTADVAPITAGRTTDVAPHAGGRTADIAPNGGSRADVAATLKAQTQQLLDAVTAGDPTVWDRYLDPRMTYLSEAGETETKASLLAQIKPLPPGITGKLVIGRFDVQQFGDTAIAVHVDEESENYFGQELHAQYMSIATWRLGPDGWKLIAQNVYASLLDPPAITLPAAQLDDYIGTYRLNDKITYAIRRDGDHLVGERTDRPAQPLRVEARDVLFVPGQPRSRKVFLRDPSGQITRFADRREARDILWTRVRK